MSPERLIVLLIGAALGALGARVLAPVALARAPEKLQRTNVNGRSVPAVLGSPLLIAGLVPIAMWVGLRLGNEGVFPPIVAMTGFVVVAFGLAGRWDDLRGHELPRGFRGHIRAARTGKLTGGMVKLLAGGATGMLAGIVLRDGLAALQVALIVPLAANVVNLTDRAPGRAGKVALLLGVPLLAFGHTGWGLAAAGAFGALAYLLVVDLAEVGMLGDMGANAAGGLLGLGIALSLPPLWRWVVIGLLLALNVISEKVSFSEVIERRPLLHRLDMLGRAESDESAKGSEL